MGCERTIKVTRRCGIINDGCQRGWPPIVVERKVFSISAAGMKSELKTCGGVDLVGGGALLLIGEGEEVVFSAIVPIEWFQLEGIKA